MIQLYKVVPGPIGHGGRGGELALSNAKAKIIRWSKTLDGARHQARCLCEEIGTRPQPGMQHTRPIPVVVFQVEFASILDVANRKPSATGEAWIIHQHADGSWRDA